MKHLWSLVAAVLLIAPAPAQDLFSHSGDIEQGLAAITGLKFTHQVPYALINKPELHKYLEKRLRDTMKPDEIRDEELILKLLGLVPQDFDLRKNTLDLLTEQAAAFYDYNAKKLFVLEGPAGDQERIALVHELAHALADQNFHLARYIHEGLKSDDAATARQAVMEGQATWLMTAYAAKQAGGKAEVPASVIAAMKKAVESAAAGQYPVFSEAPLYVRESLVFPYAEGLSFQDAVFRKLGKAAFSEVFARPPLSSGQILHPERYLAHEMVSFPNPPAIPEAKEFRKRAEGTMGEFDFRVLLTQYTSASEGESAAAHLVGASYELLEHKRGKFPLFGVASRWDSADSARIYFHLYRRVLQGKSKMIDITLDSADRLEGRDDSGYFRVWLDGATVDQIEGSKSPLP